MRSDLDLLIGRRPPLIQLIERGPGQREERYAQLLGGPVQVSRASRRPVRAGGVGGERQDLEERVDGPGATGGGLLTEKLKTRSPDE